MAHFLAELFELGVTQHGLSNDLATSIFKSLLPLYIANFNLPKYEPCKQPGVSDWYPSSYNTPQEESARYTAWISAVSQVSKKMCSMFDCGIFNLGLLEQAAEFLETMKSNAETSSELYFRPLFLPFLHGMLDVWPAHGISLSDSRCRTLYQSILGTYMRRFVGLKPPNPERNWGRTPVSCPCRDCVPLNAFITDRAKQVGRFAVGKPRRQHLHQQLDMARGTYKHETERQGNPQTLVVTKTRTEWDAKVRAWNARGTEAMAEFKSYKQATLCELLGERFEDITGTKMPSKYQASFASSAGGADERGAKRQKVRENHSVEAGGSALDSQSGDTSAAAPANGGGGRKRKRKA
jgi:hypothetical protein